METNLLPVRSGVKLYRDKSIWAGTLIGGPLAAGYLLAMNFKNLGQEKNAMRSWMFAIASTILMIAMALLIPGFEKIPSPLIPFVYTAAASFLYKQFQGRQIVFHMKNGGQTYPTRRAVLVGIIGLIFMIAIAIMAIKISINEL